MVAEVKRMVNWKNLPWRKGSRHKAVTMLSENCSLRIDARPSVLCEFLHGQEEVVGLREDRIFENRLIGNEYVFGGDAADGCVEVIEKLVGDTGRNLGSVAPTQRVFVGDQHAICLRD